MNEEVSPRKPTSKGMRIPRSDRGNDAAVSSPIQARIICCKDHNQPPTKPARRKPVPMYGQFRINCHTNPLR